MKLRRKLKKYFVPNKKNRYKPHLLRVGGVTVTALVIVALFFGALFTGRSFQKGNDFLAAVITAVLVDLANSDRANNNLPQLTINPTLVAAAQLKANDMAAKGYFSHNSPTGVTPWYWFKQAGYNFVYAGENLAVRFSDSSDVEQAWMLSPTHRANILNGHFTEIGIATADGFYEGQPTVYVVQLFGSPAPVAPVAVAPAPKPAVASANASVKVIQQDDTFIAVKSAQAAGSVAGEEKIVSIQHTPSFWEKIIASPRTTLNYVYLILSVIIFLVMTFMIGVEIRRQHPLHIAYGTALLLLMVVLLYVYKASLFGTVLIL